MYENLLANVPTDLWIGGKWRKASDGGRFDVIDPATERKIASVASATVDDAKAALDAAEGAFEGWAGRKPRERGEILSLGHQVDHISKQPSVGRFAICRPNAKVGRNVGEKIWYSLPRDFSALPGKEIQYFTDAGRLRGDDPVT